MEELNSDKYNRKRRDNISLMASDSGGEEEGFSHACGRSSLLNLAQNKNEGEWCGIRSDHVCYTKSVNSSSQTNYSEPANIPLDYNAISLRASSDNLNAANNKEMYDHAAVLGLTTPNVSMDPAHDNMMDLTTIMCDTVSDYDVATVRNSFDLDMNNDLLYLPADGSVGKIKNLFRSITSEVIMNNTEDWGIDRSIYTRYSRSGFFADCYNADLFYHGEYLNHRGMEHFAECRMPLIFCMILTNKDVRVNEVQCGIVPLAINLLDRYMYKHRNSMADITTFVNSHIDKLNRCEDIEVNNSVLINDDVKDEESLNVEIVYNMVAAACYFIADRYNGLANVSVRTLLLKWAGTCQLFTKTKYASYYLLSNKSLSLSIIISLMFDVYSTLEYKLTLPFISHMLQNLIIASNDIPYSQDPTEHNIYQIIASILAMIALIDDTFHRFKPSIITLSIYSLVRRLARYDNVIGEETWLIVDEKNDQIMECTTLITRTLSQYISTEILDALTQPIDVNEELFSFILQNDIYTVDVDNVRNVSKILSEFIAD